jgi:hypothetical protein
MGLESNAINMCLERRVRGANYYVATAVVDFIIHAAWLLQPNSLLATIHFSVSRRIAVRGAFRSTFETKSGVLYAFALAERFCWSA